MSYNQARLWGLWAIHTVPSPDGIIRYRPLSRPRGGQCSSREPCAYFQLLLIGKASEKEAMLTFS